MKNLYKFLLAINLIYFSTKVVGQESGVFIHWEDNPGIAHNGQEISVSGSEDLVYTSLFIQNISGEQQNYKWERVIIEISSSSYSDQLCDGEICFNCSGSTWIRPEFYTLNSEDSTLFQPKLYFSGGGGSARIRYYILNEDGDRIDWVVVNFSSTVSVPQLSSKETKLFPNPSTGLITIKDAPENSTITIVDMLGKELVKEVALSSTQQLNLSNLPDGVYFYTIRQKNGVLLPAKKLILQK